MLAHVVVRGFRASQRTEELLGRDQQVCHGLFDLRQLLLRLWFAWVSAVRP